MTQITKEVTATDSENGRHVQRQQLMGIKKLRLHLQQLLKHLHLLAAIPTAPNVDTTKAGAAQSTHS
jgi:hypothetical protein